MLAMTFVSSTSNLTSQAPRYVLSGVAMTGKCQPPKNRIAVKKLIVIRCVYSPTKNNTSRKPPYSVWEPPTSSCSHSDKSNGKRYDSATELTSKIKHANGSY